MTQPRRWVGLAAFALLVSACSVPRDNHARIVSNPNTGTSVPITTSDDNGPRTLAKVYFVRSSDNKIEGVMTAVKEPVSPTELLQALIVDGPPERRLESKIPKTVTFETRQGSFPDELIVILPNFKVSNLNRDALVLAFQQMVYTLTELPNVNAVKFSVNNKLYPVPLKSSDNPAGEDVRRGNYDIDSVFVPTTTTLPTTTVPATTVAPTTAPASSAPTSAPAATSR